MEQRSCSTASTRSPRSATSPRPVGGRSRRRSRRRSTCPTSTAGAGPVSVPVQVISIDDEINVVSFTPERVTVELDTVAETRGAGRGPLRAAASGPDHGDRRGRSAAGHRVRPELRGRHRGRGPGRRGHPGLRDQRRPGGGTHRPSTSRATTSRRSTSSRATVHVTIPVFQDVRNKSLPVSPVVTGTPAPGFEIASIVVEPSVVTVDGDAEQLAGLTSVETTPVSVNGRVGDDRGRRRSRRTQRGRPGRRDHRARHRHAAAGHGDPLVRGGPGPRRRASRHDLRAVHRPGRC